MSSNLHLFSDRDIARNSSRKIISAYGIGKSPQREGMVGPDPFKAAGRLEYAIFGQAKIAGMKTTDAMAFKDFFGAAVDKRHRSFARVTMFVSNIGLCRRSSP
jgi:hypothetical protein